MLSTRLLRMLRIQSSWMAVHFWGPLIPFLTVTLLRFVFTPSLQKILTLQFFQASDLALSLSVAGMFAKRSILDADTVINDIESTEKKAVAAVMCEGFGTAFFILFAAHEILDYFVGNLSLFTLNPGRLALQVVVLILSVFSYYYLKSAQEAFKLRTELK